MNLSIKLIIFLAAAAAAAAAAAKVGQKQPLTPEELESKEFFGAVQAATVAVNRISNSASFHAFVGTISATKQTVAGALYEFVAEFAATACENNEEQLQHNLANCRPDDNGHNQLSCNFQVLHQAWAPASEQFKVVGEVQCHQVFRQPRAAGPGQREPLTQQELQSSEFRAAVGAAAADFNADSFLASLHVVLHTARATKQLVAGVLYEFDTELAETECDNVRENYDKGSDECGQTGSRRRFECHHKILFQAWASQQYRQIGERHCFVKFV